jgi:ADP-ribosyl-[dinitrogen reductase] hydrolase
LEAALWAVETTGSFEDALIAAVNLGHDADTVGAVTGQIAGARYGFEAIPQRWLDHLIGLSDIKERIEILWQRSPISS